MRKKITGFPYSADSPLSELSVLLALPLLLLLRPPLVRTLRFPDSDDDRDELLRLLLLLQRCTFLFAVSIFDSVKESLFAPCRPPSTTFGISPNPLNDKGKLSFVFA